MRDRVVGVLVFIVVIVAGAWLLTPIAANALIAGALRASGFVGVDTTVDAVASPPPLLLTGHADTVSVHSSNVTMRQMQAAKLDLTLSDVGLLSRSFGSIDGTLVNVRIARAKGPSVEALSARVSGPASAAKVVLLFDVPEVDALVSSALAASIGNQAIELTPPDQVTFTLDGRAASGSLIVRDGSLALQPTGLDGVPIVLVEPPVGAGWRIESLALGATQLDLALIVDFRALLG